MKHFVRNVDSFDEMRRIIKSMSKEMSQDKAHFAIYKKVVNLEKDTLESRTQQLNATITKQHKKHTLLKHLNFLTKDWPDSSSTNKLRQDIASTIEQNRSVLMQCQTILANMYSGAMPPAFAKTINALASQLEALYPDRIRITHTSKHGSVWVVYHTFEGTKENVIPFTLFFACDGAHYYWRPLLRWAAPDKIQAMGWGQQWHTSTLKADISKYLKTL